METSVLKKRLNTFKSSNGTLRNISDEVIIDVLRAWEHWSGSSADLYRDLGLSKMQLVTILKKAKRLVKSGVVTESEFREVNIEGIIPPPSEKGPCSKIEVIWSDNRIIRFDEVEQLIDFLKKVA